MNENERIPDISELVKAKYYKINGIMYILDIIDYNNMENKQQGYTLIQNALGDGGISIPSVCGYTSERYTNIRSVIALATHNIGHGINIDSTVSQVNTLVRDMVSKINVSEIYVATAINECVVNEHTEVIDILNDNINTLETSRQIITPKLGTLANNPIRIELLYKRAAMISDFYKVIDNTIANMASLFENNKLNATNDNMEAIAILQNIKQHIDGVDAHTVPDLENTRKDTLALLGGSSTITELSISNVSIEANRQNSLDFVDALEERLLKLAYELRYALKQIDTTDTFKFTYRNTNTISIQTIIEDTLANGDLGNLRPYMVTFLYASNLIYRELISEYVDRRNLYTSVKYHTAVLGTYMEFLTNVIKEIVPEDKNEPIAPREPTPEPEEVVTIVDGTGEDDDNSLDAIVLGVES